MYLLLLEQYAHRMEPISDIGNDLDWSAIVICEYLSSFYHLKHNSNNTSSCNLKIAYEVTIVR